MKKTTIAVLILFFTSVVYFSTGCNKKNEPEKVEYIIQIDSIQHADTVKAGEVFEIRFYGPLGYNDCYEFSRFLPEFGQNSMYFTLYGEQTIKDDCTGNPKYLNGQGAGIQDLTEGEWSITVYQPEGVIPIKDKVVVIP